MTGQGAGSILKDENDPNNPFDIFTFPERDIFMEKGKTQLILSEIPVTDEGPYDFRICSQNKGVFLHLRNKLKFHVKTIFL